jgi:hypothetical protein
MRVPYRVYLKWFKHVCTIQGVSKMVGQTPGEIFPHQNKETNSYECMSTDT